MDNVKTFPALAKSFKAKGKTWRKLCVDWADLKTFMNSSLVRQSIIHKKINYDLLNGKLLMSDLAKVINPEHIQAEYIPKEIQHYSVINSKINVLRGEESKRVFDYQVVVTNPLAITEIEEEKRNAILAEMQQLIADLSLSEEEFQLNLQKIDNYFNYEWQDMREVRANALLKHYSKEQNFPYIFNQGFYDGLAVGEEIYQCDIVGGEPVLEKINPLKIRVIKSGYSNRIEDADIIILEDYWSPGKVIDSYYDVLSDKDIKAIEDGQTDTLEVDSMGNIDERAGFVNRRLIGDEGIDTGDEGFFFDPIGGTDSLNSQLLPYDNFGNVRVIRVYWKSKRKIKKVKSYDPMTGEEQFNFYPENYVLNTDMGEEEEIFWINEAWEGTKIGRDIYVNMRPRVVQYNRLNNPSRCHFGIIGSIYNTNDSRPFSLVDIMKPYSYLYDVIHHRLNILIAKNWGKLAVIDLSWVPTGWNIDKWMYFAKNMGLVVKDSFKEGNKGASTGKLAGGMNNASSGVIDAELGNIIQQYTNLLEYIKLEMADVAGISKQREGLISNRETVGGVERATLQSSHITEWLFLMHDDVKRRTLEAFLETAKIALKGRNKKFLYILSDNSMRVMDIDGDEFAECDYGLVVDNSNGLQELQQKIDMLALAALQNQTLNFSTIMKLYNSSSLAEKQRMVEKNELELMERQLQAQQEQMQVLQQQILQLAELELQKMQLEDSLNARDNDTKIIIAQLSKQDFIEPSSNKEELLEKMRLFDEKLKLDKLKLNLEEKKHNDTMKFNKSKLEKDSELKEKQINKQRTNTNK